MTIAVGEQVPSVDIFTFGEQGPEKVNFAEYCANAKVVLFAVPGAFTPTCSAKHLPGFVEKADAVKAKNVDKIACLSVNDAFVMDAWGKEHEAAGRVDLLADGNADLQAWAEFDASGLFGRACKRSHDHRQGSHLTGIVSAGSQNPWNWLGPLS
jgi:Peroxiredoxin